eukprot:6195714-Pleurochrysis_carterae.AAC.1
MFEDTLATGEIHRSGRCGSAEWQACTRVVGMYRAPLDRADGVVDETRLVQRVRVDGDCDVVLICRNVQRTTRRLKELP